MLCHRRLPACHWIDRLQRHMAAEDIRDSHAARQIALNAPQANSRDRRRADNYSHDHHSPPILPEAFECLTTMVGPACPPLRCLGEECGGRLRAI
jgi:hypothetical protein